MRKLIALAAIAGMLTLTVPGSASASAWLKGGRCLLTDDGTVFLRGYVHTYGYTGSIRWVYRTRELGTSTGWTRLYAGFRQTLTVSPEGRWIARFKSFPRPTAGFAYQLAAKLSSETYPLTGYNDNRENPNCRTLAP